MILARCPACHGRGRYLDSAYRVRRCYPCQASGKIEIVTDGEAQLDGVWMSLAEAKRVIADKRTQQIPRPSNF